MRAGGARASPCFVGLTSAPSPAWARCGSIYGVARGPASVSGTTRSPRRKTHGLGVLLPQKPPQHRARLRVQHHSSPRISSSSRAAVPGGNDTGETGYGARVAASSSRARPSRRHCSMRRSRPAPATTASAPGARSSATTRPRSVTSTTSPRLTARSSSLSFAFSSRIPMVRMLNDVVSRDYIVETSRAGPWHVAHAWRLAPAHTARAA